ncbi:LCCL domain-containing protein [Urbifossiella limnaea]|uniref:LCCL domain protein n=1 Tax=Urbifossiella limnaea TaxID=2528023 RepID=A0A517XZK7_9BACT|nr:LCCL domain-containing protein [Urbifossiella limnaea]QDU22940.1 LCCL domain protein [Urbifossiella limnaea]
MPVFAAARRAAPFGLLAVVAPLFATPVAVQSPTAGKAGTPPEAEVRCADDSVLRVKLLDESLEVVTKYGTVRVPVADVRRIDFATRTSPEVESRVAGLIAELSHADYGTRERASAQLREYREKAYHPLLKASKAADPEASRRADEAVRFIQHKLPGGVPEPREFDVVVTDDCKLTGLLSASALKVRTGPFGEQSLRLADVRGLKVGAGAATEDVAGAPAAPANMMAFQHQFGKELVGTITGTTPAAGGTGVWGTDVYTLDSSIAAAAVHAGVVQPGQTAVVKVRVVASPPQFVSSTRHGVSSTGYGNYPAGGYEFVRR